MAQKNVQNIGLSSKMLLVLKIKSKFIKLEQFNLNNF